MTIIEAEIVNDTEKMRVKSGQKAQEEEGFQSWKLWLTSGLFITSLCSGFYASVVSSGTIALVSIGCLLLSIFLSFYFVKTLFD